MEVEPASADSKPLPRPLAFNVLHLIKTAQAQHGGRYGDYQRYRRYCSARLRRLFRSLRFLHGKGKYQRKSLEPNTVTDVRHLHIPLFSAERAWAYAMELKQAISEAGSAAAAQAAFARKRAHLLRRLARAARWADGFSRLCAARADSKTALEAEAYASYMWGTVLMERETDFDAALQKFSRARTVYEQLGRVGDVEEQMECRQRAEEMEPSIRFCRYKMGAQAPNADSSAAARAASNLLDLSAHEGPGADLLQSKLEDVRAAVLTCLSLSYPRTVASWALSLVCLGALFSGSTQFSKSRPTTWSAGALVRWSAGPLVRWSAGPLVRAALTCAALTCAALTCAALTCAALTCAALTCAALTRAALTHAALTHAALTHAALTRAAPTRTALTRVALTRAALTHVALTRTALTRAALTRAALTRTALTRTAPTRMQAVMEEARSREAANLAELDWLGHKYSVLNAKTRVCILKAQQLEAEVASADVANDRRLNLYDKIFVAYHDAKRLIRDDMVAAGGAEDVKEQLAALDRAVSCLVLQRTIDRNLLLVAGAKARLDRQQQQQQGGAQGGQQGQGKGAGGGGEGKKGKREKGREEKEREKPARPEDLIRLYDTLLQNASDLADLAASGRDARVEEKALQAQLEANKACYQACRAFYVALAYQAAGKDAEAYVVFGRAAADAEQAATGLQQLQEGSGAQGGKGKSKGKGKGKGKDKASEETEEEREVQEVVVRSKAQRCAIHARATLDAIRAKDPAALEKGVAELSLRAKDKQVDAKYMTENLNEFVSAVTVDSTPGSKLVPHIARVPPPFQAVPCRPIVLDTALNAINFPDLAGRAKKEGKKAGGLFSSFWGGGRS
ncbi:unnamed protein product [Closterium sp. NIES-53]